MYKQYATMVHRKGGYKVDLIEFLEFKKRTMNLSTLGLSDELGFKGGMLYFILKKQRRAGVKSMRRIANYFDLDIKEVVRMNDRIK